MESAAALIVVGILLSLPAAMRSYTRPLSEAERPGAGRRALLGLSILGMLCLSTGAVMFFGVAR